MNDTAVTNNVHVRFFQKDTTTRVGVNTRPRQDDSFDVDDPDYVADFPIYDSIDPARRPALTRALAVHIQNDYNEFFRQYQPGDYFDVHIESAMQEFRSLGFKTLACRLDEQAHRVEPATQYIAVLTEDHEVRDVRTEDSMERAVEKLMVMVKQSGSFDPAVDDARVLERSLGETEPDRRPRAVYSFPSTLPNDSIERLALADAPDSFDPSNVLGDKLVIPAFASTDGTRRTGTLKGYADGTDDVDPTFEVEFDDRPGEQNVSNLDYETFIPAGTSVIDDDPERTYSLNR